MVFASFRFCLIQHFLYILGPGIQDAIAKSVLEETNLSVVFKELRGHMLDNPVNNNHMYVLIKSITKTYCKVRFYHLGREYSGKLAGEQIRQKFTALIHFADQ